MTTIDRIDRSAPVAAPEAEQEYNHERFRPQLLVKDAGLTLRSEGATAGDMAPDFELRDTVDRTWTYEQKLRQAELFRQAERLPWPVLIDGLEGGVHRAYGLCPTRFF